MYLLHGGFNRTKDKLVAGLPHNSYKAHRFQKNIVFEGVAIALV